MDGEAFFRPSNFWSLDKHEMYPKFKLVYGNSTIKPIAHDTDYTNYNSVRKFYTQSTITDKKMKIVSMPQKMYIL